MDKRTIVILGVTAAWTPLKPTSTDLPSDANYYEAARRLAATKRIPHPLVVIEYVDGNMTRWDTWAEVTEFLHSPADLEMYGALSTIFKHVVS